MDINAPSTDLSYRLAKAVSTGRTNSGRAENREAVLVRLLVKRAAAHRAGLADLEQIMRRQIIWSLPVIRDPQEKNRDLAA